MGLQIVAEYLNVHADCLCWGREGLAYHHAPDTGTRHAVGLGHWMQRYPDRVLSDPCPREHTVIKKGGTEGRGGQE